MELLCRQERFWLEQVLAPGPRSCSWYLVIFLLPIATFSILASWLEHNYEYSTEHTILRISCVRIVISLSQLTINS